MGELPSDYQVCCEGRICCIGSLAEAFLSWPLWYNKDGLVGMAYTTCTTAFEEIVMLRDGMG